jgi:chromosome segregation ATPase
MMDAVPAKMPKTEIVQKIDGLHKQVQELAPLVELMKNHLPQFEENATHILNLHGKLEQFAPSLDDFKKKTEADTLELRTKFKRHHSRLESHTTDLSSLKEQINLFNTNFTEELEKINAKFEKTTISAEDAIEIKKKLETFATHMGMLEGKLNAEVVFSSGLQDNIKNLTNKIAT